MRLSVKLSQALLAAVLLAVLGAGNAFAGQPESLLHNDKLSGSFVDTEGCPGMEILSEIDGKRSLTVYYDSQGNETRFVANAQYAMWFTNLANGVTITGHGTRHIVFDSVKNIFSESGLYRVVTKAGEGIVWQVAGRYVETLDSEELLSVSGPHEGPEAFCAALAG